MINLIVFILGYLIGRYAARVWRWLIDYEMLYRYKTLKKGLEKDD